MTHTIKSRYHGKQTFQVSSEGGYVRLNGKQICHNGRMLGVTLTSNAANLPKVAKRWWTAYLKNHKRVFGY